ncbi:hypothetical protein E4U53_002559 [Claviceps sorghi]|nr:hypothetical protein E4U53_002559 [Claviceps sorghi]
MRYIRSVRDGLVMGQRGSSCSYACAQMQLESLFMALDRIGLANLPLTEPFGNRSVQDIKDVFKTPQTQSWARFHRSKKRTRNSSCYLDAKLQPIFGQVCRRLSGLKLEDHRPQWSGWRY